MKFLNRLLAGLALVFLAATASATDLTDYAENRLVDSLFRAQSLSAPATLYVGLDTAACGETGSGTEVTGGSYARVAVAASLANFAGTQSAGSTTASSGTSGTTSNNAAVTFPTPTAGWGTVVSVRWWDASTSGNAWICTDLTVDNTISTGNSVSFPIGSLTFQIDN
ncbi:phage tail fiber protein [Hydrogenophaga sp.]|uniref:phage tail fiber protein n=1 Tax=Hydrogenophaga sp. TaxID=1904254 RepID=UPI003D144974